jgi:hypothetical protein
MPLVVLFAEALGAFLLLTSAIADASFADVITGKAEDDYRADQGADGSSDAAADSRTTNTATSAGSVSSGAGGIVKYLVANGLTPIAAAGVVGNLQQESSLNAGEAGGGLAQWIGSRWNALEAFASRLGLSPSSQSAQLQYLVSDLKSNYASTLAAINAASSPEQAATIFSDQYERPGVPDLANRQGYAQSAYKAAGY